MDYKIVSKTPIYWQEGGEDLYISRERKDSYKILEALDAKLHYEIIPHCTHTQINPFFWKRLKRF